MAIELKQNNGKAALTTPTLDITQAIIEEHYNPDSENAQSGKAVAEAIEAEKAERIASDKAMRNDLTTTLNKADNNEHDIHYLKEKANETESELADAVEILNEHSEEILTLYENENALRMQANNNEQSIDALRDSLGATEDVVYGALDLFNDFNEDLGALYTENLQQQEQIDTLLAKPEVSVGYTNLYGRVEITADDIAQAGDEGITLITIGGDVDLTPYSEIIIKMYVPLDKTLNSEVGALRINATTTEQHRDASEDKLLFTQSLGISTVCGLQFDKNTPMTVKAVFADDDFLYGQVMRNGYSSSHGYAGAMNTWTNISEKFKKSEKKYFHIFAMCLSAKVPFKFPVGSYVDVYAR